MVLVFSKSCKLPFDYQFFGDWGACVAWDLGSKWQHKSPMTSRLNTAHSPSWWPQLCGTIQIGCHFCFHCYISSEQCPQLEIHPGRCSRFLVRTPGLNLVAAWSIEKGWWLISWLKSPSGSFTKNWEPIKMLILTIFSLCLLGALLSLLPQCSGGLANSCCHALFAYSKRTNGPAG